MFFNEYYLEIKNRLFLLMICWVLLIVTCYFYKEILLVLVIKSTSFNNLKVYFIFTDVKELFNVYIKLICFISNQFFFILLLYHLFLFLCFGLYKLEYIRLKNILKNMFFYWFLNIILSYKFIIPFSWFFFLGFQQNQNFSTSTDLIPFFFEAKISEYFDFFTQLYVTCLICFQFLCFSVFILNEVFTKINVLKIKFLRKWFYFIFLLLSTIITPPDILNQVVTTGFLIFCYELIIFNKIIFYSKFS